MPQLDLVIQAINKTLDPQKIILFGSQATGNATDNSDFDIAVVQKNSPKLGQKAEIYLTLVELGYDWKIESDIHVFSEKDFSRKLAQKDLFVTEVSKGKVIYA